MSPHLSLSDTALAKIVAQAAVTTPGVTRLAPRLGSRLKRAALRAARQITTQTPTADAAAADPDAIDIDDPGDGAPLTITIRIIASADPPVRVAVEAVHQAVTDALATITQQTVLTIRVIDVDPGP